MCGDLRKLICSSPYLQSQKEVSCCAVSPFRKFNQKILSLIGAYLRWVSLFLPPSAAAIRRPSGLFKGDIVSIGYCYRPSSALFCICPVLENQNLWVCASELTLQMVHMALTALFSVTNLCFKEKKIRFQCFMWWENTALQCCVH